MSALARLHSGVDAIDPAWASRYRTASGSDRILHSTCHLQFRWRKDLYDAAERLYPVATACGSV